MTDILGILEEVAATSKRKEKQEILQKYADEPLLSDVIWCAYALHGDSVDYPEPEHYQGTEDLSRSITLLVHTEKDATSDDLRKRYHDHAASLSRRDAEVFRRMVNKDLRCGVGAKGFNQVWKDLIYIHPYQRCATYSEKTIKKIQWPAIAQEKLDGMFMDAIVTQWDDPEEFPYGVLTCSREGREITVLSSEHINELGSLSKAIYEKLHWGLENLNTTVIFSGEALVMNEEGTGYLPREIGNGLLNSEDIDPSRVRFVVWDAIPEGIFYNKEDILLTNNNLYGNVFAALVESIKELDCKLISYVPFWEVNSMDEVADIFAQVRKEEKEGLILKNKEFFWCDGTNVNQIKLKMVVEGEMLVTGINEGEGKYVGHVGSLNIESADGLVQCSVAGLSDAMRKHFFENPEKIIGKVITVRYNDIVERDGVRALYLPRMVEIRKDKTVADTFERLLEQLTVPNFA